MDKDRFDSLARSVGITASRRGTFRVLAASITGAAAVRLGIWPEPVEAEEDDDEVVAVGVMPENLFGCKNVGETCDNDGQCCSNNCDGAKKAKKKKNGKKKKGRKGTCKEHNVGSCSGQNACDSGSATTCGDSGFNGVCFVTTGNGSFCGRQGGGGPPGFQCATCRSDSDCQNILGWPSDSACIVCSQCQFQTPNSTACTGPAAG